MIEKQLKDITIADILALVSAGRGEGRTIDFKVAPPTSFNDNERKELARDVASFANGGGGDIVFGVDEDAGIATKADGFACSDPDKLVLQMEGIIRDGIDPRVVFDTKKISGFPDDRIALVVRVQRSWNGPHMVVKGTPAFYSRGGAGKYPLDVRQIRAAFAGNAEVTLRARRFRDERLGRILADETPLPLMGDQPARLVTHIVPLIPEDEASLNLQAIQRSMAMSPPMPRGASQFGSSHRYNLDGYVTFPFVQGLTETDMYFQAFRIGAFEAVISMPRMGHTPPRLFGYWIESRFVECATLFLNVLDSLDMEGPVALLMTVVGAKGYRVHGADNGPQRLLPHDVIDRDVVILPDVVFENDRTDVTTPLRPSFDVMWQASGWDRSYGYDAQGKWDVSKHNE